MNSDTLLKLVYDTVLSSRKHNNYLLNVLHIFGMIYHDQTKEWHAELIVAIGEIQQDNSIRRNRIVWQTYAGA